MDYCIHDLPANMCGHCTGRTGDKADTMFPAKQGNVPGRWIEAKFPGKCSSCPRRISPGDQIRADGEGGWQCDRHEDE